MMMAKSHEKHPSHKDLYDALIKSLFMDEDNMDKAAAAMGNTPPKSSNSGKSVTTKEQDEEHVHDMSLDAEENIANKMGNADEYPDGEAAPKND
ncbi:hypothetical protein Tco_0922798 [Tanacetum coccineum]|uniref:Uncharacterized protein n=1 Tax=Tanacetum coccineum TaxID=301880 RepID=A0ABQ5D6C4_9ASTR